MLDPSLPGPNQSQKKDEPSLPRITQRNGKQELPKGFYDYGPEFYWHFLALESNLRSVGIRHGFEPIRLSKVEQLHVLNPFWDSESRMFVFPDRSNRRLNLPSNSIVSVSRYLEGIQAEHRPNAVQFSSEVFRYRNQRYRAFHQYCYEACTKKDSPIGISILSSLVNSVAKIIPESPLCVRISDKKIISSLFDSYLNGDETESLLHADRFGKNDEIFEIMQKVPPERMEDWRRLRAKLWSHDEADEKELRKLLPTEQAGRLEEVLQFAGDVGGLIDFRLDFATVAIEGIYFKVESNIDRVALIDGGEFKNPSQVKNFQDMGIIGLAVGIEATIERYGSTLPTAQPKTSVYLEGNIRFNLSAVQERMMELGVESYSLDFISRNIGSAIKKAKSLGLSQVVKVNLPNLESKVYQVDR